MQHQTGQTSETGSIDRVGGQADTILLAGLKTNQPPLLLQGKCLAREHGGGSEDVENTAWVQGLQMLSIPKDGEGRPRKG